MTDRVFVENRLTQDVSLSRSGLTVGTPDLDRGLCIERHEGNLRAYDWNEWSEGRSLPALLQGTARAEAEEVLAGFEEAGEQALLMELASALQMRGRERGAEHVDLQLRRVHQRVLTGPVDAPLRDVRTWAIVELRVWVPAAGRTWDLWRCASAPTVAKLHARLPELVSLVESMVDELAGGMPPVECPSEMLPVVFPPGAASGSFFHELCGHPLEGDVVVRGGSYLARRRGERVAADFVTIRDNPCAAPEVVTFARDDEGIAARPAVLIDAGRIAEPILDLESAAALGLSSNGHARRVSFRHRALPRMTHTEVAPHSGTLEQLVASVERGLLIQHITPRHMDLLSG
ncbi:MAG: TldD/PmbA family protein, partial [Myxococcaceae bacterium]